MGRNRSKNVARVEDDEPLRELWRRGIHRRLTSSPDSAPLPVPPGVSESTPAQHFNRLSQALLTFRQDRQRAPRDWQELISSGYLKQMPIAPPGRRYAFDRSLNVQMLPAQ